MSGNPRLLTRTQFRETTLARLGGRCCVPGCPAPAVDAHHILNRNLWHGIDETGGYLLDNGAPLCSPHHLAAEQTRLSCADLRAWIGIARPLLPEHLADGEYDTWGNPVNSDGTRLPGELFYSDACQTALRAAGVLHEFQLRWKYPRTFHLPWSAGRTADDRVIDTLDTLSAGECVVTIKMDGEATTIYSDGYTHARSTDSGRHPSRDWVRSLAARIGYDLPPGWRVCGENLYAAHSLPYQDLPSWFMVYSIWDRDRCMSWDDTAEWAALLDLVTVPVLYRGPLPTEKQLAELFTPHQGSNEGYVVRRADSFSLASFSRAVAKWVRPDHVQTDEHWTTGPVRVNSLASDSPASKLS